MSSLSKLRKRNNNTNYSDDIYSQYIEDYQLYFENTLNKTDYIDYYDKSIIGKCIILDVSFNNATNGDEKYITTLPNSNLYIGQILSLKFEDDIKFWIITEKEHLAIPSHDKFKMRPCNFILKWMMDGIPHEQPCIVTNNTKYTGGTKATSNFVEVDAMVNIAIQSNTDTRKISYGKRLFTMKNAWQVTLIDNITTENILSFTLGKDALTVDDNVDLGICDYYKHDYTISLSSNSESIVETSTYQISATVKDNNTIISNPTINYKSSDETIATVSNGLIIGLKQGSCIITCSIGNASVDLDLTVTAKTVTPVISYSCDWTTGKTSNGVSLKTYMSSTATCKETIDGVVNSTLMVNYSLDSVGSTLLSTGAISITRKSNVDFLVKNISVNTSKSFVITFTNSTDNSVISNQTVSLTGM